MAWFDRNNTNNEPDGKPPVTQPIILTDEHYERIASDVAKKLETSQGTNISAALAENPILKRLNENMDAAERNRQTAAQQRTQQTAATAQTEFETAYAELPAETRQVIDTRFGQVNERSMRVEAREVRRSVFEDIDNYPYYTGDVKKKVDDMLDLEPLSTQVNPTVVKNAYKVVLSDHIQELQQNKLRSRLSSATGSSGTAAIGTPDPNALPTLSNEEKDYATKMGIKHEDWAKTKKELIEAGEVSGV
jgi:hypothetical protein